MCAYKASLLYILIKTEQAFSISFKNSDSGPRGALIKRDFCILQAAVDRRQIPNSVLGPAFRSQALLLLWQLQQQLSDREALFASWPQAVLDSLESMAALPSRGMGRRL